jgi:hypothetical protein
MAHIKKAELIGLFLRISIAFEPYLLCRILEVKNAVRLENSCQCLHNLVALRDRQ